jgi:tetratricopeptide (TPR) repeat protein
LIVLSLLTMAAPVFADASDEAKSRFGRGVELYKEGDYRAALIEFRRAHELAPNYKVLYNIGQASLELSDYAGAFSAFRRYLDEGKTDVPADKRKLVEGEIGKLEARVARVTVKTDVEGAEITIDDVAVGKTPLAEPVLVSAGRRRIAVVRSGVPAASRVVDLAGGDKPTVLFEVAKEPPPAASTQTAPLASTSTTASVMAPPPPPAPRSNTPVYVGLGVTGAFAVGTGVFAYLALASKGDLDKKLDEVPTTAAALQESRDKVKRLSLVADVLGGVTLASGAITTYLALRPANNVRVGLGPSSVSVGGRF